MKGLRFADGTWLKSYDPDGGDLALDYPTGVFTFTDNRGEALHFEDAVSAIKFWSQPSTRTPLRPDGKPNRPLTALTVMVDDL